MTGKEVRELFVQRIKELEYSYERALQEGEAEEVAYKEGELSGWRAALAAIENLI